MIRHDHISIYKNTVIMLRDGANCGFDQFAQPRRLYMTAVFRRTGDSAENLPMFLRTNGNEITAVSCVMKRRKAIRLSAWKIIHNKKLYANSPIIGSCNTLPCAGG